MDDQKNKVPLPVSILFGVGILSLWVNLYWQMKFNDTYSSVKTETKTKEIFTHGNTYYVDPVEYKKTILIRWGGFALFGLGFAVFGYYKYKKDPTYFRFFKKRDNRNI